MLRPLMGATLAITSGMIFAVFSLACRALSSTLQD